MTKKVRSDHAGDKASEAFLDRCNKVWQEGMLPRFLEARKPH